ncbi:MAG: molybdopterin molybdotransferase MoeA [Methyloceanibacter sp.]|uniref:molybdopterin molybdotransferase MoeA n=1 Tax=Methyloceanibacter sp. TaxID=1965321 RepID=UPI003D9ADA07
MALLSVADALARILDGLTPLDTETVALTEAHGRVLAEDLAARLTQPPFDASAMDGYAVRAEDVVTLPATLQLIGESAAGAGFKGDVRRGQTVRIFTGAPVPNGADTIVIQENAEAAVGVVTVTETEPGRHIRPRGQDFNQGEILLHAGTRLGPRELMLAAAMNHAELTVRRKPKVAILATGDEIMPPGTALAPDQIVSSVPYGLAAMIENEGGEALSLGIAKDDPESLVTLARAGSAADILVTIGGASVGDRDLVASALKSEGLKLDFWKVAMRPGNPLLYGRLGSTRLLGLPGNPVSALVCAHVFLLPMLRRMLGVAPETRPSPDALLGEDLEANGAREHYMRAVSAWSSAGERVVRPLPSQDSSLVAAFASADCLIVRAADAPPARQGARVKIIPLEAS